MASVARAIGFFQVPDMTGKLAVVTGKGRLVRSRAGLAGASQPQQMHGQRRVPRARWAASLHRTAAVTRRRGPALLFSSHANRLPLAC